MKIGVCKLCDQRKQLVRAHIIPDVYYRGMMQVDGIVFRYPGSSDEYRSKLRTGEYDDELLCEACESTFSEPERYAKTVFLDRNWSELIRDWSFDDVGVLLPQFDYSNLKRFCLGLAWKAAETKRPFFKHTKLGPRTEQLRQLVRTGQPGEPDDFAVFIMRFNSGERAASKIDPAHLMLSPATHRMFGHRFVRFYFSGFAVSVKTDSRLLPEKFREFCLRPNAPLWVVLREFVGSKAHEHARRIMRKHPS